jgi:hypothetical protein
MFKLSQIMKYILILVIGFVLSNCAGQFAPSGGPVDTIPPRIINSEPAPGATHFLGNRVLLKFSEYIDQRSLQDAVFISPNLGNLEYEWSGTEVEIKFSRQLRDNTTYVLSVGTDVRDYRNGNKMKESYSLAFSTGGVIDSCVLSGRVFDDRPSGLSLFAYNLENKNPDTLDPKKTQPDYVTQTAENGFFNMPFLSFGKYRIFTIRDEYRNFTYDPQVDQYGTFNCDINLSADSQKFSALSFQLTFEDTTSPFIDAVTVDNQNKLTLHCSETIDTACLKNIEILIRDTSNNKSLQVKGMSIIGSEKKNLGLMTEQQDTSIYRLSIGGLSDTAGNVISKSHSDIVFRGTHMPDTVRPLISYINVKDSVRDIPFSSAIELRFSEPIQKEKFEKAFLLIDSNNVKVEGRFYWLDGAGVSFSPMQKLQSLMFYKLKIVMDSVSDFSNNTYKDSIFVRHFITLGQKKLGEIRGLVKGYDALDKNRKVVVELKKIKGTSRPAEKIILSGGDKFIFENLEEGQYMLDAFLDIRGDEKYDYGKVFPFKPSERFTCYPDTVKVRARWPVDGVIIDFKR